MNRVYGYVRVSTKEQNEDRQLRAMDQVPVPKEDIYVDKESGKDFNRPMYRRLVRRMRRDDVLYIKSIDRLGRDYKEILEQWRVLTKEKGVEIVVLDMPLLDTRRGKDLVGTFLSDVVLQSLSFVAENERKNIRERQREGIEAAKRRGVQFGRPAIPMPEGFEEVYARWLSKEISGAEAAKLCGITQATFYRRARKRKNGDKDEREGGPEGASGELAGKKAALGDGLGDWRDDKKHLQKVYLLQKNAMEVRMMGAGYA